MIKRMLCISMLCVLLMSMFAFFVPAARAQQAEASKQPVVYTYVSFFGVPRAQWGAYEKNATSEHKVFDGLLADGTILSYGDGALEVHEAANAPTHVGWFTSSSMAGLMKALAALRSSAPPSSEIAYTMHSDAITMSTMYNGKGGTTDSGYVLVQDWTPKPGHAEEFKELITKYRKPALDAAIADGALSGYSVEEDLIHTDTPGAFTLIAVFPNAAAMDKFYAEIEALHTKQPLFGDVYSSVVDYTAHRDHLIRILYSKSK
ncbi:MAG: hypothetical protein WCA34_17370 [Candidatus Acidiferrales bacterium]